MLQLKHFFTIKYTYLSKYTNESIYLGSRIEKVVETTSWDYYEAVQRFQRMDSARTQPGSGLGLALVDSVADMHGGDFILTDAGGPPEAPGLKAILRLPRV